MLWRWLRVRQRRRLTEVVGRAMRRFPCDQLRLTAMASPPSPRRGASDAWFVSWRLRRFALSVGRSRCHSACGRTASGLRPGLAAPRVAVVLGPCHGRNEVERPRHGASVDFAGPGACGPAGDAGVFVRRRGVAEAGAVRGPGGLGFAVERAPGVARRRRVVVVAACVPGSEQRGDRQREGVDDRQRRVGRLNRTQNQNRAERVTSLPGIGAKFFRNDVCTRASSSVRLRPRRSTSRIWLPRTKRRPTWAFTIV